MRLISLMSISTNSIIWNALAMLFLIGSTSTAQIGSKSNIDQLPAHIKRLTYFGERPDWSPDGKKVVFIEKTYGDAYEVEVETGKLQPITTHFYHGGFTRALYLSNGDVLLCGSTAFDAENHIVNRIKNAEMWVLSKDFKTPPMRLDVKCYEGPAVSRTSLKIAWTQVHEQYPDLISSGEGRICMGEIVYKDGVPSLQDTKVILDNPKSKYKYSKIETQNFIPPHENELTFQCYSSNGTEVVKLDIGSGKITHVSNLSGEWTEPEGIFPDGKFTTVESDHHSKKGVQHLDIYKLKMDGSSQIERLTFFNDGNKYKASNPVVSDDGKFMTFQFARVGDPPGVGWGIFVYDLDKKKIR